LKAYRDQPTLHRIRSPITKSPLITQLPRDLKTPSHYCRIIIKPTNILLLITLHLALFGCGTEGTGKGVQSEKGNLTESQPKPPPDYQVTCRRVFYVWGNAEIVASIDQDGNTFYYHNDPWGNPQAITDSKGNIVWRRQQN